MIINPDPSFHPHFPKTAPLTVRAKAKKKKLQNCHFPDPVIYEAVFTKYRRKETFLNDNTLLFPQTPPFMIFTIFEHFLGVFFSLDPLTSFTDQIFLSGTLK